MAVHGRSCYLALLYSLHSLETDFGVLFTWARVAVSKHSDPLPPPPSAGVIGTLVTLHGFLNMSPW